jgi:hypothetical protein
MERHSEVPIPLQRSETIQEFSALLDNEGLHLTDEYDEDHEFLSNIRIGQTLDEDMKPWYNDTLEDMKEVYKNGDASIELLHTRVDLSNFVRGPYLGGGVYGEVYLHTNERTGDNVAVKFLNPLKTDPTNVRIEREL